MQTRQTSTVTFSTSRSSPERSPSEVRASQYRDRPEFTTGTMGSSADSWLGPKLEQELKNAIAWKKRDNDPTTLSTSAVEEQSAYSYDGSNLWMAVMYAIEEPVLVQVQQVSRCLLF